MMQPSGTTQGTVFAVLFVIGLILSSCGEEDVPVEIDPELVTYVDLVAQAELKMKADPRKMLAIMRQLYYGQSWSATSTNVFWKLVIPCSPTLPDPRAELGTELFNALATRAETGGVDMGHVFAGLEAMVCPSPKVLIVNMSSEEFATWGGDLGAAVAARAACLALGKDAATTADCGSKPGGQTLDFYLQHHLPPQDLEGDLDPFALRAALTKTPCASSGLKPLTLVRPLSEVLGDYYLRPTSTLGQARQRRDRCILEFLDATWSGDAVTNNSDLVDKVSARVSSFAETYYVTIRNAVPAATEKTAMGIDARTVTDGFLKTLRP